VFAPDPSSPVPVYHQIAEHIRARIAAGELAPGQALEPLRLAARRLGVNLHTVRHAYTALAREGLVEARTARGTRVARTARVRPARRNGPALEVFLQETLATARTRYGLEPRALAAALSRRARAERRPAVSLVECSLSQCRQHARELEERFALTARPWSLERAGEPPPGTVLSTYFHYNDVRRRWPWRLADVHFLTIRPDPALGARLTRPRSGRRPRLVVLERDAETAANVAADLSALLPRARRLETVVSDDPRAFLARVPGETLVLCPPRVWAALEGAQRAHPRVLEVRYRFEAAELEELGGRLGWTPAGPPVRGSVAGTRR